MSTDYIGCKVQVTTNTLVTSVIDASRGTKGTITKQHDDKLFLLFNTPLQIPWTVKGLWLSLNQLEDYPQ